MLDQDHTTENMTPFVETLKSHVTRELGALFQIPSQIALQWRYAPPKQDDGMGRLTLSLETMDQGDLNFFLADHDEDHPSWAHQNGFQIGYHILDDGTDPHKDPQLAEILKALRRSFEIFTKDPTLAALEPLNAALEQYKKFDGITDSMYRQLSHLPGGGVSATLRLGFRCNQDCGFCWQARTWPEPDSKFYFTWLDELAQSGAGNLSITGGEPTLHKALPGLVERAAKEHQMSVSIQTNAIRLAKEKYLRTLLDAGLNDAFVSFHSADPEISDMMTRAPRTHQFTVKGIEAALDAGLIISLNCVVEKQNYKDLPNHARMIVERFTKPFPNNPPQKVVYSHPCSYYDQSLWKEALVPLDDLRPYLVDAIQVLTDANVPVDVLGSCGFPPCLFKDRPELLRALDRDLYDTKDVSGRVFIEPCNDCALQKHCLGVRQEYLEHFGGRGIEGFAELPDFAQTAKPPMQTITP